MKVKKLTLTWLDHCVVEPSGIARSDRALAKIHSVTARIESAFAVFANIPNQDAPTQREMVCLLEEFKVDKHDPQIVFVDSPWHYLGINLRPPFGTK
jgi:hypothetical protein